MLSHNETMPSNGEIRSATLEAALRVGTGLNKNGNACTDGSIVVKNSELFLKFLMEDAENV